MKDDYTASSHYITYTFPLKGWENVLFELASERVTLPEPGPTCCCSRSILVVSSFLAMACLTLQGNSVTCTVVCHGIAGRFDAATETSKTKIKLHNGYRELLSREVSNVESDQFQISLAASAEILHRTV